MRPWDYDALLCLRIKQKIKVLKKVQSKSAKFFVQNKVYFPDPYYPNLEQGITN
tara:strand:+ start:448 stop:609 length:162 start_codon:yes stop_codon:yes gene_type:complete